MENFGGFILGIIYVGIAVLYLIAMWILYSRAGKPGWAVLIPFYNIYVFLKIAGKPGWWLILMLIPLVNLIVGIMALAAFLKAFGREGAGPVLLAIFFGFIYFPYLAFSKDVKYGGIGEETAEAT